MKQVFVIAVLSITLCASTAAQAFRNAGSTGAQFLKIGVGARAMGMGGAYASIAGDATALAWNPAGIGTIESIQLSAEHTTWVAGMDHNFIGLVVPITDRFNLAFHTIYITSGGIEITTIDNPEGTGSSYDVSDVAAGITSSVRLTTQLTFAATVKYLQERIYDVQSGGVAADAGAWYATGYRSLTIGFAILNLGFDQKFSGRSLEFRYNPTGTGEPPVESELQTLAYSLPLMFRASGSFDVFEMFDEPVEGHTLKAVLDFVQHADTPEQLIMGAEYTWQNVLSVRSGYVMNADELSWSAGGGARLDLSGARLEANYAVSSLGRFGLGHRFGISVGY